MPPGSIPDVFPNLAVEGVSASNTRHGSELKRANDFAVGARHVWEVDPPARFTVADSLSGEPVLPGFTVAVAGVFDVG